ncbi:YfbU family protein [Bradyrhizobium sp. 159]|uniref:YfbU family protein n=1 Tax=Bradyrhizobium sp. 159 TaxID=2782632 RepID=UPI0031FF13DF|nr:YfbU family protein [Bradyrhizobium sp. 159]
MPIVAQTIYANQLWGFDWQFSGIPFERTDETPPVVQETVDILEMFSLTMFHFQQLPEAEQKQVRTELGYSAHGLDKFPGFDGNHDDHYRVASYLIKHLKRFKDLPGATNNSHTQTSLPRYRKMLSIYLPIRDRLDSGRLAPKQIIEIFSA